MVSGRQLVSAVPVERRDEFWRIWTFHGVIKWPSCFRHVSALALEVPAFIQNIECHLMYNYPVNHGDMFTCVGTGGRLSVSTGGSRARMSHVFGIGTGGRDQCHLCLIDQAFMAACS